MNRNKSHILTGVAFSTIIDNENKNKQRIQKRKEGDSKTTRLS